MKDADGNQVVIGDVVQIEEPRRQVGLVHDIFPDVQCCLVVTQLHRGESTFQVLWDIAKVKLVVRPNGTQP